jgi:hypothetical protein
MSDLKPRSVVVVIHQLVEVIPENEIELIQDLEKYADGLWNICPKLLGTSTYWRPLANILGKHIKEIDTEWKKTLVKIHNNEPDSSVPAPSNSSDTKPSQSAPKDEKTYYHHTNTVSHGEENRTQRTLATLGMCLPPS